MTSVLIVAPSFWFVSLGDGLVSRSANLYTTLLKLSIMGIGPGNYLKLKKGPKFTSTFKKGNNLRQSAEYAVSEG